MDKNVITVPITPIVKFLFRQDWGILEHYVEKAEERKCYSFSSSDELFKFSSGRDSMLLLVSLVNKEDLLQVVKFFKSFQRERKIPGKLVVVDFSGHPAIEGIVMKLGVQDIISTDIPERAFKFKLDFWLKTLDAQLKVRHLEREQYAAIHGSNPEAGSSVHDFRSEVTASTETPEVELLSLNMDELTRGALVKSFIRKQGQEIECVLNDMMDRAFVFNVGHEFFQLGDTVELNISLAHKKRQTKLKARGKVSFLHFSEEDGNLYVTVETEDPLPELGTFMEIYQERQQAISTFLQAAHGR